MQIAAVDEDAVPCFKEIFVFIDGKKDPSFCDGTELELIVPVERCIAQHVPAQRGTVDTERKGRTGFCRFPVSGTDRDIEYLHGCASFCRFVTMDGFGKSNIYIF